MKIHHLSCGSLCPLGGRLFDGVSPDLQAAMLVCHCLLIETDRHGLVLVDTGLGTRDIPPRAPRISPFFNRLTRPTILPAQTAIAQVKQLGFSAGDVRHILMTHLDFDHAGGIDDFPDAMVHLHAAEKFAALHRDGWIAERRFRPPQWSDHISWQTYEPRGERWFGFEAVRQLRDLPPEILMIPLIGHTSGHSGIAVQSDEKWLLHAGDAYFFHGEVDPARPWSTPFARAYQRLMDTNRGLRLLNQRRLGTLVREHADEVDVFSAHDQTEFRRFRPAPAIVADYEGAMMHIGTPATP